MWTQSIFSHIPFRIGYLDKDYRFIEVNVLFSHESLNKETAYIFNKLLLGRFE